ncbi:F-box domain- cyclin-like protein [Apiospora rasikravindrae]|uniref:F-box domain- cyclin-like protein n=1 Tax=Apiospora rasikravindrae TaxID=990691 RepID=A0ABR1SMT9_9PEZI
MVRMWKNMKTAKGLFAKLPDEIVLRILHAVPDKISILILRQTCRQLRRLCEDPTLEYRLPILLSTAPFIASFHQGSGSPVQDEVCQPGPEDDYRSHANFGDKKAWEYCQLLWRDQICDDCAELRRDLAAYKRALRRVYQTMLCSSCKAYHPVFLFSLAERQKGPSRRVCIGRQGHVRLCQHETVNWQHLVESGSKSSGHTSVNKLECAPCCRAGNNATAEISRSVAPAGYRLALRNMAKISKKSQVFANMQTRAAYILERLQPFRTCVHLGGRKSEAKAMLHQKRQNGFQCYMENWGNCYMHKCGFFMHAFDNTAIEWLAITSQHILRVESPTDPDWLVALDPESYLGDRDELTRGLMWCRDPNCSMMKRGHTLYALFHQKNLPHETIPLSVAPEEPEAEVPHADEFGRRRSKRLQGQRRLVR